MPHHLDADLLADLQEGLLDGSATAAAQEHLRTCESCREDAASLAGVRQLLATAPDVGPMPSDVVARLDRAMAAERADSDAEVTLLPTPATRRWWADHRVLQAAAAIVLVFAGGAVVLPLLQAGGSADMPMATSDRADNAQAGAAKPVLPPNAPEALSATGNNYTEETLAREVRRLVASRTSEKSAYDASSGQVPASAQAAAEALDECIAAISPGAARDSAVLVDVARFEDQDATLIVLEIADQPDQLAAWVVAPDCGGGDTRVLHYEKVPRP